MAGAALTTLGNAVHAAVECLALHGAIGFTWEHDLHLYWRRAIALAGSMSGPDAPAGQARLCCDEPTRFGIAMTFVVMGVVLAVAARAADWNTHGQPDAA